MQKSFGYFFSSTAVLIHFYANFVPFRFAFVDHFVDPGLAIVGSYPSRTLSFKAFQFLGVQNITVFQGIITESVEPRQPTFMLYPIKNRRLK